MKKQVFDTVVIGGGASGLTAAIFAARQGSRVLVLEQKDKLTQKLSRITGKEIALRTRIDPRVLGGIRLDYDGQRLDDTVSHRMDAIRDLLNKTVL